MRNLNKERKVIVINTEEKLEAQRQIIKEIDAMEKDITGEIGKGYLKLAKLEAGRMKLKKAVDLMEEAERSELIGGRL